MNYKQSCTNESQCCDEERCYCGKVDDVAETVYEKYAIIDSRIKDLESQKNILKEKILMDMVRRGSESEKHVLGKFTISKLKSWTYPEKVLAIGEKFKSEKAKAESMGTATYTENDSLRFTSIRI